MILNPVKVDADALRAAIAAEPAAADWAETLWYETTEADPGGGQAKQALEAGADLVIAAGGDGTIRAVAEVLGGTSTSLALLPSGTGNLLARNLDLTLDDMEHSIRTSPSTASTGGSTSPGPTSGARAAPWSARRTSSWPGSGSTPRCCRTPTRS